MSRSPDVHAERKIHIEPLHTFKEIFQQSLFWPTTLARVLLADAGTSAYPAGSIAAAWPRL
jgi:hypothetical protein